MKATTLLLGLLLTSLCYAQNTAKSVQSNPSENSSRDIVNSIPEAQIMRSETGTDYTYEFVSNRMMSAERAARWEERFVTVYANLVSISIDSSTQQIVLVLPNSHLDSELQEMVARFGYSGFQLTN